MFEYTNDICDPCIGEFQKGKFSFFCLRSNELNSDLTGKAVSGFKITGFGTGSGRSLSKAGVSTSVYITIHVKRQPETYITAYIGSGLIVWLCSWLLFFVSYGIPPAVAGAVIAQVVLVMITNNLQASIIKILPAGTSTCYLQSAITSTLALQMFQLTFHLARMGLVQSKLDSWLKFISITARWAFLFLFVLLEGICLISYFSFSDAPGWYVIFIILTIASFAMTAFSLYNRWKVLDPEEKEKILSGSCWRSLLHCGHGDDAQPVKAPEGKEQPAPGVQVDMNMASKLPST